jgi:hypothetical protein
MRRLAPPLEVHAHDAEEVLVQDRAVEPVDHHRAVHPLEHAGLDQLDLAAAALLRRRADDLDPPRGQPGAHGGQRRAGAGSRGGDDVVAARVPDAGQRVVLAEDRHGRPRAVGADPRPERGRDAADPALDGHPPGREELTEPLARLHFLVGQLGVSVDLPGQRPELLTEPVDRALDLVLGSVHWDLLHRRGTFCRAAAIGSRARAALPAAPRGGIAPGPTGPSGA